MEKSKKIPETDILVLEEFIASSDDDMEIHASVAAGFDTRKNLVVRLKYTDYVNPAKRNVLDLKNETCKNREKRNVLKVVARTTKKSSLRWAAFLLFKRQTNGVRIVFKSRRIPFVVFVQHDVCVRGAKIHVRVKLRPPAALKRVARCAVLAQPLAELYNLRFVRRKIHKRPVSQHLQHVKIIRQPPAHSICPNLRREVRRVD